MKFWLQKEQKDRRLVDTRNDSRVYTNGKETKQ